MTDQCGFTCGKWWLAPDSSSSFNLEPQAGLGYELEEYASVVAQRAGSVMYRRVVRNEPFILLSGQPGWIIVSRDDSQVSINCLTIDSSGRCWLLKGHGPLEMADSLLGVCESLCAE